MRTLSILNSPRGKSLRAASCVAFLCCAAPWLHAATITVNSTADVGADEGQCTLREAITAANTNGASGAMAGECIAGQPDGTAADFIRFDISGSGVQSITIGNANLPSIASNLTIDGYTQPGATANTLATGNNAVLRIRLTSTQGRAGLTLDAGGSTIRGLNFGDLSVGLFVNSNSNRIVGNFIGTDATGATAASQMGICIHLAASSNQIGDVAPGDRNVLSGCGVGIEFENGAASNLIRNNYVGTNAAGTAFLPMLASLELFAAGAGNVIGGTSAGAGNVLIAGVHINPGADNTVVQGNLIGTDATGTLGSKRSQYGVSIYAPGAIIGGAVAGARNVISGNDGPGIVVDGRHAPAGATIQGNYIGTDPTGTIAVPNELGIEVFSVASMTIGGSSGQGNLISGNDGGSGGGAGPGRWGDGIFVFSSQSGGPTTGLSIVGNIIGLDATGTTALGNRGNGIFIDGAFDNSAVSNFVVDGNVISANGGAGILMREATIGTIDSNLIGTNGANADLGNGCSGIHLDSGVTNVNIGSSFGGNTIAFNRAGGCGWIGTGVSLSDSLGGGQAPPVGNLIRHNAIYDNDGRGIDLGGITFDLGDADSGPNNLQNAPSIVEARVSSGMLRVRGNLDSAPSSGYTLEFFASPTCSSAGASQGRTSLGTANVSTDASGTVAIDLNLQLSQPIVGFVSATATGPGNNTSEFSTCATVQKLTPTISLTSNTGTVSAGNSIRLLATVSGTGPTPTGSVRFSKDGAQVGTAPLDANGVATLDADAGDPGDKTFIAAYEGDAVYDSVTSSPFVKNVVTAAAVSPTQSGGDSCFIATAAYGSYLEPEVVLLRRFRDQRLLTNSPGRAFVEWYYRTSPSIAAVIRQDESLRSITRMALTPIVYAIKYPSGVALLLGSVLVVPPLRRRLRARASA